MALFDQQVKIINACLSLNTILEFFLILSKFGKITLCAYLGLCAYLFLEKCRPWAQFTVCATIRVTRVNYSKIM